MTFKACLTIQNTGTGMRSISNIKITNYLPFPFKACPSPLNLQLFVSPIDFIFLDDVNKTIVGLKAEVEESKLDQKMLAFTVSILEEFRLNMTDNKGTFTLLSLPHVLTHVNWIMLIVCWLAHVQVHAECLVFFFFFTHCCQFFLIHRCPYSINDRHRECIECILYIGSPMVCDVIWFLSNEFCVFYPRALTLFFGRRDVGIHSVITKIYHMSGITLISRNLCDKI
jgi:hypothetical protein